MNLYFCDTKAVCEYAIENGYFVLQDACETFDPTDKYTGDNYCLHGDITTLSFYHPHHLSSYGGGAVVCSNRDDYILCDSIVHWGRACKCHIDKFLCTTIDGPAHQFTYERIGVNVEMSELNACFGRWQLMRWGHYELRRRENYQILYEALKHNPNLKVWKTGFEEPSRFVFPIKLVNGMTVRDVWEQLLPKGVEIRTLMGGATCTQPAFGKFIDYEVQQNAINIADTTFFVGVHQTLSINNVQAVARIINFTFK